MENIFIDTNLDFEYIPEVIKLTGVTFEGRQDIISQLQSKQPIQLKRAPFNEYDKYAIKVFIIYNNQNIQIGWIPKSIARIISPEIDVGIKWQGIIEKIIGGNDKNYGILVRLNMGE